MKYLIISNSTKFQLNRIGTYFFQLKLFNTSVTLKYNQGHWKWYGWVKLNEYHHHAKIDIYHIYSVRENRNVEEFATHGHSLVRPNTDYYIGFLKNNVKPKTCLPLPNNERPRYRPWSDAKWRMCIKCAYAQKSIKSWIRNVHLKTWIPNATNTY